MSYLGDVTKKNRNEDVWTLLEMGIFQPAMLVYQRVQSWEPILQTETRMVFVRQFGRLELHMVAPGSYGAKADGSKQLGNEKKPKV